MPGRRLPAGPGPGAHPMALFAALGLAFSWTGCALPRDEEPAPEVDPCTACHGSTRSPAPPVDLLGNQDLRFRGVGAHEVHLFGTGLGAPVACDTCHLVPSRVHAAGHLEGPWPAEVVFSGLAVARGAQPGLQAEPGTGRARDDGWLEVGCAGTYCHGSTLAGGGKTAPAWNRPAARFTSCDACHGSPPPAPHPVSSRCSVCHPETAGPAGTIARPDAHVDGQVQAVEPACDACHGGGGNPAPPPDASGETATTLRSVGAHRAHLSARNGRRVACSECHRVPGSAATAGHLDGSPAEVVFGPLANLGTAAGYDVGPATCATYCHGATLAGGRRTRPQWTRVDGTQASCGACHGLPPPAPHPAASRCSACHPTAGPGLTVAAPDLHVDGVVQVAEPSCNGCHGSAANPAPPQDASGGTATTLLTVGAHQAHLSARGGRTVACSECHRLPAASGDPGHLDGAPAEVLFGQLAGLGTTAAWSRGSATCSTYCHGATLAGGALAAPRWTRVDGTQAVCGACHGLPPPAPHPAASKCADCHPTAGPGPTVAAPDLHVDGVLQVAEPACNGCHGGPANPAPPRDTSGGTATTLLTVGAHQAHLSARGGRTVACSECHRVPAASGDPGHLDGAPAEVLFGQLAGLGTTAAWSRSSATCSTYCHGATLGGGTRTEPRWTRVDGTQAACGTCHGLPPPAPHPAEPGCADCHPETAGPGPSIVAAEKHVDGVVQLSGMACNACHGSARNAAPPRDSLGGTATALKTVGAHQTHLEPATARRVACAECHLVPASVGSAGHLDAFPAEVVFGQLAGLGTRPTWSRGPSTCANYCHGAGLSGGSLTEPVWTRVDGTQAACGTCHGLPPPAPYPADSGCAQCHAETAGPGPSIVAPDKHVDGVVQASGGACGACHGSAQNAAPPRDVSGGTLATLLTVGAHQTHLAPAAARPVACGECHLVPGSVGATGHLDAAPAELVFGPLARQGTVATWNRGAATCANYCHGTGPSGGFSNSPVWTTVDGTQAACGACHGLPPPAPHAATPTCVNCHAATAGPGPTIATPDKHVDGTVQLSGGTCGACHGSARNAAPPLDTSGGTATTLKTVGAHQAHLEPVGARPVGCSECHPVPAAVGSAGHLDASPAEVVFGALAGQGTIATWSRGPATCANYCHGTGLAGGSSTAPLWTKVDGTQAACGACHGISPPTGRHPANLLGHAFMGRNCTFCHEGMTDPAGSRTLQPALHVNGAKDVRVPGGFWNPATRSCTSVCHGPRGW